MVMATTRVQYFTWMNPLDLHGLQVDENPYEFIENIQKINEIMDVTLVKSAYLAAYPLKGVAQIWFKQWKEEGTADAGLFDREKFKDVFLDRFFPLEMRVAKVQEIINLRQGNMTVKDYSLKFTQLSKYASTIVVDSKARMSKVFSGVSKDGCERVYDSSIDQVDEYLSFDDSCSKDCCGKA